MMILRVALRKSTMLFMAALMAFTVMYIAPTPAEAAVPSPWSNQDIGSPAVAGSANYASGVFTVAGAGSDIYGTSDQFQFVYQTLNGNGSIVARVASITNNGSTWAKGAVMIRDGLGANAIHATTVLTQGNGAQFSRRTSVGGSTSTTNLTGVAAPYWVKIERSGNTFTSSVSSNGTSWTTIGSATISMGTTVYIGMAVTSVAPSTAVTAAFDNVSVTTGGGVSSNLALGKSGTASSVQTGGYAANNAFDGSMTTRWSADFTGDPQWIYVDLGSSQTVSRVVLKWEAAYADAYQIQVSANASTWTNVYSTTTGNGGTDDISFTATSARYVRMYGTHRATSYSYSLWEFEVYGESGPPDTQAPTAPTNLASPSKTHNTVNLTWTASTDNVGVTGYNIYRDGATLAATTNGATSVTVQNLTPNTTYTFTVKAIDAALNESAASNPVTVTTNAAPSNRSGLPWKSGLFDNKQLNPQAIVDFENWRGRLVDTITDFMYRNSWANLTNGPQLALWDGKPYQITYAVPFFPEGIGATFSACAAGNYNSNWASFGTNLVAHNQGNAIIRLGWEFNGDWFQHSVTSSNINDWKACFRQVVTSIRSTAPDVKIDWNVNRGHGLKLAGNADPALAYPGDEYVDIIGIDSYDMYPPALNETTWNNSHLNGTYNLQYWANFAAAHGKKFSVPEWGLNHGDGGSNFGKDNPFYIHKMWDFFNSVSGILEYEGYYNEGPGGINGSLTAPGLNPNGAAAYNSHW